MGSSKAERSCLTIRSGTTLDLFDSFVHVYDRMLRRKQFTPSADVSKHRCIQQELPEPMRMRVVLACFEDEPCAGAIYSALGDTAVYLFGATDEVGMRSAASYLVQWQVVQELKQLGVAYYDLNGVDPRRNHGTYVFKRGLAGKDAIEVTFAGQFQATNGSIASRCVALADQLRYQLMSARARWAARGV
jgi:lipid II:glycine glycyltransferase (peptidoglycan interpeptide bridge formation enzyme)